MSGCGPYVIDVCVCMYVCVRGCACMHVLRACLHLCVRVSYIMYNPVSGG